MPRIPVILLTGPAAFNSDPAAWSCGVLDYRKWAIDPSLGLSGGTTLCESAMRRRDFPVVSLSHLCSWK